MKKEILTLLQREIIPTIGSLELANVALCTAYATSTVGGWAQEIHLEVSPEIMNHGKRDRIPELNRVGLEYAAALGSVLLNPDRRCLLMAEICDESIEKATRPEVEQHVHVSLRQSWSPWYVRARVYTDWGIGTAEIRDYPGDIVLLQMAARKVWEKERAQKEEEVRQKKLVRELTEEQLEDVIGQCSEKELLFLKPGLDYTNNLLFEITEDLNGGKPLEELAEEMEKEVRRGCKLPCMTAGYSIREGGILYLKALRYAQEQEKPEEVLRYLAREGCHVLAKQSLQ